MRRLSRGFTTARKKSTSRPKSPSRTAARERFRAASRFATCRFIPQKPRRSGKPHEGAFASRYRGGRGAALGRECRAFFRGAEGDQRRLVRHPQRRNPRDYRAERRRQDVDAERDQRLLLAAIRQDHLKGWNAPPDGYV